MKGLASFGEGPLGTRSAIPGSKRLATRKKMKLAMGEKNSERETKKRKRSSANGKFRAYLGRYSCHAAQTAK